MKGWNWWGEFMNKLMIIPNKKIEISTQKKFESMPVVIDMLNDFVRRKGSLYVPKSEEIIKPIEDMIEVFRIANVPVIYITDAHNKNSEEFGNWLPHAIKGSWGGKIIWELSPKGGDYIIEKDNISAFTNPNLRELLNALGVEELYVSGVATEYCVKAFVLGCEQKFTIYLNENKIRAVKEKEGKKAIEEMKKHGAIIR